jgi:hypothetical protein
MVLANLGVGVAATAKLDNPTTTESAHQVLPATDVEAFGVNLPGAPMPPFEGGYAGPAAVLLIAAGGLRILARRPTPLELTGIAG